MTDVMATSADTWRDRSEDPPAVPDALRPPGGASPRERYAALWRRHDLRRVRAEQNYAITRSPARGWPVADNHAVLGFFRDLVLTRRGRFASLVVLNALAAAAGLVVPRLLGELVNRTVSADGGAPAGLGAVALLVVAVVCAQALLTFAAQRTSTLFGQDLLASAREYIVHTILRLPLGRVEGASTGDLVTRVTRDVGTMSRAMQYGVPMAVVMFLTVLLSVGAMLLNSVLLALPSLLVIGASGIQVRRYLRRASVCYIAEGASYARINTTLTETVEGARTV
jgi:ABC-type multidrug transport system fused ATPase/permease subunit